MTRESFADFVNASERSSSLRKELRKCNDNKSIIELAKSYGFTVTNDDINKEHELSKIEEWFKKSKISPFHPYS